MSDIGYHIWDKSLLRYPILCRTLRSSVRYRTFRYQAQSYIADHDIGLSAHLCKKLMQELQTSIYLKEDNFNYQMVYIDLILRCLYLLLSLTRGEKGLKKGLFHESRDWDGLQVVLLDKEKSRWFLNYWFLVGLQFCSLSCFYPSCKFITG
jgi:hypothetical protein